MGSKLALLFLKKLLVGKVGYKSVDKGHFWG